MAELFKDIYSKELFGHVAHALSQVNSKFNKEAFFVQIFNDAWENMEFKERMHHVAEVVRSHLSADYKRCIGELNVLIASFKRSGADRLKYADLAFIFIPDIIENYGLDDFENSVVAMEKITPFTSCEFAVRPFIIRYETQMIERLLAWAQSKSEHVRRLASEGSRSRLPWAMAIQAFKKNPAPIMPILEVLKNDPSEYVRRSVANSLNDISKDNPERVIQIAKSWIGKTKETDWIVKHACRSLLKGGNPEIMELFGFCKPDNIEVSEMNIENEKIKVGDRLDFHFLLHNKSDREAKIRLEYGIYYLKNNGMHAKKVFKISEKEYVAKSATHISRHQSFKIITTRKFYPGKHLLSVIINGVEIEERAFELLA